MPVLLERTRSHYHDHVDDPHAVGRRLRDARLAAGLSQRQLSFPGCSAAYLSRLEAGDRVPSYQLAAKIARRLDVDVVWLLTGEPDPARALLRDVLPWFEEHDGEAAADVAERIRALLASE
jgi:transcriptional regulator with XRE-family HTH domain